jgi:hypothetical protein
MIDMPKVEEQAYKRSRDRKDPQGTLIHYHDFKEHCYYEEHDESIPQMHKLVLQVSDEEKIDG